MLFFLSFWELSLERLEIRELMLVVGGGNNQLSCAYLYQRIQSDVSAHAVLVMPIWCGASYNGALLLNIFAGCKWNST